MPKLQELIYKFKVTLTNLRTRNSGKRIVFSMNRTEKAINLTGYFTPCAKIISR
jgi:hypothetical protein